MSLTKGLEEREAETRRKGDGRPGETGMGRIGDRVKRRRGDKRSRERVTRRKWSIYEN
jgi:hypothetical protein